MPMNGKAIGNDEPAAMDSRSVVLPHARTVTFMALRIPAGWRAHFVFTVGLNDINLTPTPKCPLYSIVEPCFRQFPVLFQREPFGLASSVISQPKSVVTFIGKLRFQRLPFTRTVNHRDGILPPDCFNFSSLADNHLSPRTGLVDRDTAL